MNEYYPSESTLLDLNGHIKRAICRYIPLEERSELEIRFDLPEQGQVNGPTISVFLYDIQEDLQLRNSEHRHYNPAGGNLAPAYVQARCYYLITYWEKPQKSVSPAVMGPESTAMKRMNYVLNALINHCTLPEVPNAYCRVLPPVEHLNSLGAFWQALGSSPRLTLGYMVTVPIALTDKKELVKPVKVMESQLGQKPVGDLYLQASYMLWNKLYDALGSTKSGVTREQLEKVTIHCTPYKTEPSKPDPESLEDAGGAENGIHVKVSGAAPSVAQKQITDTISGWKNEPIVPIEGATLMIRETNDLELNFV